MTEWLAEDGKLKIYGWDFETWETRKRENSYSNRTAANINVSWKILNFSIQNRLLQTSITLVPTSKIKLSSVNRNRASSRWLKPSESSICSSVESKQKVINEHWLQTVHNLRRLDLRAETESFYSMEASASRTDSWHNESESRPQITMMRNLVNYATISSL